MVAAVLGACGLARADDHQRLYDAIDRLGRLAFDPERLFTGYWEDPVLTILYRGDDVGVPVYALAVVDGCAADQQTQTDCRDQRRVRFLRGRLPSKDARIRERGYALVRKILDEGAQSDAAVMAILDRSRLEWLEADLKTCKAAAEVLATADRYTWVPPYLLKPPIAADDLVVTGHADTTVVTFDDRDRRITYNGIRLERSPAEWAATFVAALEPCLKRAKAPVPWRTTKQTAPPLSP